MLILYVFFFFNICLLTPSSVQLSHSHHRCSPTPPFSFHSNAFRSSFLLMTLGSSLLPFAFIFFHHKIQIFHEPHSVTFSYFPLLCLFFAHFVIYHVSSCLLSADSCSFLQMLHNFPKACSIQFRIADTCLFLIIPSLQTLSIGHRKGSTWVTYL